MLQTEAIQAFLQATTWPDLASMYTPEMEVQVNVHKGPDGRKVEMGKLGGKNRSIFTNDVLQWFPIRIPHNANAEPNYEPKNLAYPLEVYCEGIGMTGWNWVKRQSEWFAFDFDAVIGHSDLHSRKLTEAQLADITKIVRDIPFVTLRKSTSGRGLHIYVHIVPTSSANHNEHAAMARAVLSMMSGLTGYDFASKVDICGGNMWVYHNKMYKNLETRERNDGLELIKSGCRLDKVPSNWRDHISVVSRKARKATPNFVFQSKEDNPDELFMEMMGQRSRTPLDANHKKLIEFLNNNGCAWWWDNDNWMAVTHTFHLLEAHRELKFKGEFQTLATGTERGHDHNCFMYPLPDGAWAVRRFSPGVNEAPTWTQDGRKWTRCFLNREPDLLTLSGANNGVEDEKGAQVFTKATDAIKVLNGLGCKIELHPTFHNRSMSLLYKEREGKLIAYMIGNDIDDKTLLPGWLLDRKKWRRVFNVRINANADETETGGRYDEVLRHIRTQGADAGWVLKKEGVWVEEPPTNISLALRSSGYDPQAVIRIMGGSVWRDWNIVNQPFSPEYPGNRQWNRDAAQFKIAPSLDIDNLKYPHWQSILNHLGFGLDDAIKGNKWCQENGITKGSEFLMLWIAAMFRHPEMPTTYLAFWGEQDSGKSILHEAISQILMTKGVMNANTALDNQGGFNRELLSAVLCYIEEINLQESKIAYNRVKDWVTSPMMQIHEKGKTPYMVPNCTHWISCTNDPNYVPIFPGDTRITMIYVQSIPKDKMIPKPDLMQMLLKEAPDFLAELLNLEIPRSNSRLLIPTIETDTKARAMEKNANLLEEFIRESCYEIPGAAVLTDDFYQAFVSYLEGRDTNYWTAWRVRRSIPERFPRGRIGSDQRRYYGNLTITPGSKPGKAYRARGLFLTQDYTIESISSDGPPKDGGQGHSDQVHDRATPRT